MESTLLSSFDLLTLCGWILTQRSALLSSGTTWANSLKAKDITANSKRVKSLGKTTLRLWVEDKGPSREKENYISQNPVEDEI